MINDFFTYILAFNIQLIIILKTFLHGTWVVMQCFLILVLILYLRFKWTLPYCFHHFLDPAAICIACQSRLTFISQPLPSYNINRLCIENQPMAYSPYPSQEELSSLSQWSLGVTSTYKLAKKEKADETSALNWQAKSVLLPTAASGWDQDNSLGFFLMHFTIFFPPQFHFQYYLSIFIRCR